MAAHLFHHFNPSEQITHHLLRHITPLAAKLLPHFTPTEQILSHSYTNLHPLAAQFLIHFTPSEQISPQSFTGWTMVGSFNGHSLIDYVTADNTVVKKDFACNILIVSEHFSNLRILNFNLYTRKKQWSELSVTYGVITLNNFETYLSDQIGATFIKILKGKI